MNRWDLHLLSFFFYCYLSQQMQWSQKNGSAKNSSYLQCTVIGPSWPNCSLVLCTWPMKSMNPSPDFGTPCSGQSVNWNWRTVRDWPSWRKRKNVSFCFNHRIEIIRYKWCTLTQRWLTLASVTLNSRRMYWGMLYSAMGSTTKYWYLAERSAGQYWWHFSCKGKRRQNLRQL